MMFTRIVFTAAFLCLIPDSSYALTTSRPGDCDAGEIERQKATQPEQTGGLGDAFRSRTACDFLTLSVQNLTSGVWYATIQEAVDAASPGDEIVLRPGVFTGEGNRDVDFKGKDLIVRGSDPNDPDVVAATVIDCQGAGDDPHRGFYFHSGETNASIVAGLTITNGHAGDGADVDPNSPEGQNGGDGGDGGDGGAILCLDSSPKIVCCVITENRAGAGGEGGYMGLSGAGGAGGGVCCDGGDVLIVDCTITGNCAGAGNEMTDWPSEPGPGGNGGGVCCTSSGCVTILRCTIAGNSAGLGGGAYFGTNQVSGGFGGGVYCESVYQMMIQDCSISGNVAGHGGPGYTSGDGGSGGGIYCSVETHAIITGCSITDNRAEKAGPVINYYGSQGDSGHGGGICCVIGAGLTVADCEIIGNRAGGDTDNPSMYPGLAGSGGGIHCSGAGDLKIENCLIVANDAADGGDALDVAAAGGDGGGLCCADGVMIVNCTISTNRAGLGGPAHHSGDGGRGGGVFCGHGLTMLNCTISGNASGGVYGEGKFTMRGGGGGDGGGVWCGDDAAVVNCAISGNCAGDGGDCESGFYSGDGGNGGGLFSGNDALIINCSFAGNAAGQGGNGGRDHAGDGGAGAGLSCGENSQITGCSIVRNVAGLGGVAGSSGEGGADGRGGGAACAPGSTVANCIVWRNDAAEEPQITGDPDVNYSCVQDWTGGGEGVISQHPAFRISTSGVWTSAAQYDPLTYQTTFTDASADWTPEALTGLLLEPDMHPDPDDPGREYLQFPIVSNTATTAVVWGDFAALGDTDARYSVCDYRLLPLSPCIDAADNSAVPLEITSDLDGLLRFADRLATPDAGLGDPPVVDMGAYEYQCNGDLNGDGQITLSDLAALLANYGQSDAVLYQQGDLDQDGDVDLSDLAAMLAAYGSVCG